MAERLAQVKGHPVEKLKESRCVVCKLELGIFAFYRDLMSVLAPCLRKELTVGGRRLPLFHSTTCSTSQLLLQRSVTQAIQVEEACPQSLGTGKGTRVILITKKNFFKQSKA